MVKIRKTITGYLSRTNLLIQDSKIFKMGLEGFEPPTSWFVAMHSIQLSYKPLLSLDLI